MTLRIVALAGSLRRDSLNRRLIAASVPLAPTGMRVEVFDNVTGIPLFNEDLEAEAPAEWGSVAELRRLVAGSDGLLIATPEYNQSIPGVTKNVVDWLSRPAEGSVLDGRPVAILGATDGPWGTRYAQKELRHTLTAAGAIVMPQPQLFVARAASALGDDGLLVDPAVESRLAEHLAAFERWIVLVGSPRTVAAATA